MRVIGIVWHAAAIDDVWKGTGDAVTLDEVELTKLLDRRLRTVERLRYEASAGAVPGRIGSLAIDRAWDGTNKPSSLEGPMARRFCGPTIRGPEHSAFRAG
jgi:hypothetical protein